MKTEALLSTRRSPIHLPLSSSLAHILLVYPPAPSSQLSQSLPPKQHALNQLANNEVDFFADLPIISLCASLQIVSILKEGPKKLKVENNDVHPDPINPSLLHLQHTHRSLDIWRLGGGDMLKCRRKNPNNEDDLPPLDLRMVPLLQSTGFYGVARVASLQLDWSLISALVERWRPQTHTFHLSVTITLQDVGVLLGLPVDGDVVISDVTPDPDMS
ncbi:hypothetical protein AgCh_029402 [Apium graveolens]